MKLRVMLLLCLLTAAYGQDDVLEFGFRGGAWIPTGSWISKSYTTSPALGANLMLHLGGSTIEANLSFVRLREKRDLDYFSGSIVPVSLGFRRYTGGVHFGAGMGMYLVSERYEDPDYGEYDETSDMGGMYYCVGTRLQLWGMNMELEARYHLVDYAYSKSFLAVSTVVRI